MRIENMQRVKFIDKSLKDIKEKLAKAENNLIIKSDGQWFHADGSRSEMPRLKPETVDAIRVLIKADFETQREELERELESL